VLLKKDENLIKSSVICILSFLIWKKREGPQGVFVILCDFHSINCSLTTEKSCLRSFEEKKRRYNLNKRKNGKSIFILFPMKNKSLIATKFGTSFFWRRFLEIHKSFQHYGEFILHKTKLSVNFLYLSPPFSHTHTHTHTEHKTHPHALTPSSHSIFFFDLVPHKISLLSSPTFWFQNQNPLKIKLNSRF